MVTCVILVGLSFPMGSTNELGQETSTIGEKLRGVADHFSSLPLARTSHAAREEEKMSKEELEATLDGEIGDDELDEVSDDETYDFGVESERTMIQQTEGKAKDSPLSFFLLERETIVSLWQAPS